ncbi:hypothetical protein ACJQWK_08372 [Exserohilum turcicum]
MGGRRMRSTEHALHAVTSRIYQAWNKGDGQVASLLLLDVSGAFDNVSHPRLLHNLRKRKVDERTVKWIASFLSNRHTRIAVDGFTSQEYAINTGIPQGSPLSPILYLFYNADLIDECNREASATSTGYIDDVAILAWGNTAADTCSTLSRVLEKAQRWAITHASVFAPDKFQLTHFTRSRTRINRSRAVQTSWGEVTPKPTCKYLGLTIDSKLQWKEQVEEIRRKATKTLYEATALPQMMYACSIWSNASVKDKIYTKKTLNTLQSIQARAARAICGAYKATSRAALDIEAHLLPIEQQISKHNADVITRLLSSKHMVYISNLKVSRTQHASVSIRRIRHIDSWQKIYDNMKDQCRQDIETQEPIPPFIIPPWRHGPKTHIDKSADKARSRHDREHEKDQSLSIYTDGSGKDGEIGAAAVCPLTQQTRTVHMGPGTVSTVYAAELQGISLALQITQEYVERGGERRKIAIYTDNQAAIWSVAKAEGRSGAYILADIAERVKTLQDIGRQVTIRWIPAHTGIPGNEAVDRAAKEATGWREDGRRHPPADAPPRLYRIRSTVRRWCRIQTERAWIVKWRAEAKGRATYRHTPLPTKKIRQSALLVQLRTEKIGLRDFLFTQRVPGVTSSRCQCGERRQTVAHILLHCRRLKDLRNQVFDNLRGRHNLQAILSKPQLATKAIQFIEQAQILGHVRIEDT